MLLDLKLRTKGLLFIAVPIAFNFFFVAMLVFLQQQAESQATKLFNSKMVIGQTQAVVRLLWEGGANFTLWGFTHTPSFEQRMMKGLNEVPREMAELKALVVNDPVQKKNVDNLEVVTKRAADTLLHYKSRMVSNEPYLMTAEAKFMVTNYLRDIVSAATAVQHREMDNQKSRPKDEQRARLFVQIWLLLGVVANVPITFLLVNYFSRSITGRLATISGNAQLLSEHRPLRRPVEGNDEIAQLDIMFHKMAIALQVAAQRERAIIDNAQDVICSLSDDGSFTQMSPACKRNWGYDPIDLLQKPFASFVLEEDRERLQRVMDEAKTQTQTAMSIDVRVIRKDGSAGWMLWSIFWSPVEQSFYCVAHDISDRKELDQMKQDFVNMVSHDLRTPLTGMRAFLDSLGAGVYGNLSDKGGKAAARMQNSLGRLVSLVNDLLDVEKMESGRMEMRFNPVAVKFLIDASLDMVRGFAEEQKVKIEVADIPDTEILADSDRMVQVLQNLLANAIKFSPAGGTVTISANLEPGSVTVRIADQGVGIAESDKEAIFDRFRQAERGKETQKGGTGLGLAICKAILEQHNGSVGVESQEGEGSTFWFRIPCAQKPRATA